MENYDIIEGITIGAHSVSWKERSRITGQFFCLKVIKKQKYSRHWRKVMGLFAKYKTIDHANQTKIYLFFHDKQCFYILQELVEGRTLYEEYLIENGFNEIQLSTYIK